MAVMLAPWRPDGGRRKAPGHRCADASAGPVHHQRYATRAAAKAAIQEYIESFYNRQRRHSRLGNVPPALFAEKFSKQPRVA